ncbi:uncharacterized protein METZ01_LOCUS277691, partial [marine metagenome]
KQICFQEKQGGPLEIKLESKGLKWE